VVEEHLAQAIQQYSQHKGKEGEGVGKAHFTLAQYMDSLYQGLLTKAASSEWAATQELRQHKERELELCEKTLAHVQTGASADKKTQIAELSRHILVLRRVVEGDRQDSQRLADDRDAYLTSALTHYIDALLLCDRYDVRAMFRVCSLWFNNSSLTAVNTLMRDKGTNIPSYKFLPLIYQITSRVSANPAQGGFQAGLCAIIERVATTHPHHVLYQLFALKNGEIEQAGTHKGTSKKQFVIEEDKVRAAKALLGRLQRGVHAKLISEVATLIKAYVDLTNVEHNSAQKKPRGYVSSFF
jgi:ataxia telangiectasia mutated family protein